MENRNVIKINSDIDYVVENVKKDLKIINEINNDIYLELTKEEVIDYLNKIYDALILWKKYFSEDNIDKIINEYNNIESIMSELELCLVDYDNLLNIEDISYTFYQIGNRLVGCLDKKRNGE